MKKLLLTLLMLLCGYSASNVQSNDRIKSAVFTYLHDDCGYETVYDSDGDIQFTMDDLVYYAIIKMTDEGYALAEFRIVFESNESLDELLTIANDINRSKYLCKCMAEPGRFQISMEFAAANTAQALFQTEQALHWFPIWIEDIKDKF